MRKKIPSKYLLLMSCCISLVSLSLLRLFFPAAVFFGGNYNLKSFSTSYAENTASVYESTLPADDNRAALPIRLKIPKIKVDAALEYVGINSDGAMNVPNEPADAAWFDLGPRPGENGTSVVAGHFGWKDGKAAVFDNLSKVQKGDEISVENEKGMTVTFVVRELKTYVENDSVSEVFASNDGVAHLNLITCKGVWSKTEKSYSNRLVVFADKK